MANGLDASDILSSYFQGAEFVTRGIQRAEEREKQQRVDRIRSMVGTATSMFEPQFKDGKLVERSMTDIMNSPEFKEMANSPEFQTVLMQGVNDPAVKRVVFTGADKDPRNPNDGSKGIPKLQHIGEDGQPLGPPGPLTVDRSRGGNAVVAAFTPDMAFRHLTGLAYSVDPELGRSVLGHIHQSSVQSLRTLARNAKSPQELEGIIQAGQKAGISPQDIVKDSGRPYTVEESSGVTRTHNPLTGDVSVGFDPGINKRVTTPATVGQAKANNAGEDAVFGDEQYRKNQDQIRSATTQNDLANQFNPDANQRASSLSEAQHSTNQRLIQQDNQAIEKAVTDLDSKDPAVVAQAQQGLLKYFKSPEDARNYVRGSQAETKLGDLRSAVLSGTPDDAYRNVAKELPYANKDTQLRVFTELAPLANDPDPKVRENAQAGLRAAANAMKGPQQGKAADPGEFNASMASSYMKSLGYKSDTPEFQSTQAGATEAFNRLRKALPNEITKGSQAETYATIASVKAHDLAQQGMPNAEKPMFIHSELEDLGYPVQRMGTTKDFVKEIYNPLGDALTKAGIPEANDPTTRRIGTELVVGLKSNGVSTGIAVNEVVKLFKDPPRTYLNKLEASGGDLRSLASGLAKEIKERPSALGQALDKTGRAIDAASME